MIGSGNINLVTKNGENGEYDLDYNLVIQKDKNNLCSNPKRIKELFINAFNEQNSKLGFKQSENSRSVITVKLVQDNRLCFSFDVAVLFKGNNGNYMKIIFNKRTKVYYWNEIKNSQNYQTKIAKVKENNLWNEVRKLYLCKKNFYLKKNKEISSFSVLLETLNEICERNRIEL